MYAVLFESPFDIRNLGSNYVVVFVSPFDISTHRGKLRAVLFCITISFVNRKLRNMKLSIRFVYVLNHNMK